MFIKKGMIGIFLALLVFGSVGCSGNQTVKDAWKGTRGWWYSNVSVPASIDYDETGEMTEYKSILAKSMIGIDVQLTNLEKLMSNADKPPTNEWVQGLFGRFPWLNGFSGIKADGEIIGQVPGMPLKPLSFYPLLEEDEKQNLRALRAHVQNTPMGPETFLATPLYDSHTFLGVVAVYFDMRELLQFSETPDELIIIAPQAVLWAGKYNFASTPMAGIEWDKIVLKDYSGTVSNANGKFYWTLRYFGNLPLIFAVAVEGNFEEVYNARTGPVEASGFVEPTIVETDETDEDIEEIEEVEEIEAVEESTESAPADADAAAPSPIHPDQPDTDDSADTSSSSEDADTTDTEPAAMPSPIHPDQPSDESSDSSDTDSDEDVDASDSSSVDSSSEEDDDEQDGGYRPPSPFGS